MFERSWSMGGVFDSLPLKAHADSLFQYSSIQVLLIRRLIDV